MFGQRTIKVTALAYVTFSSIQKNWQGQTRLQNPFFYGRIMQDIFPLSLGTFLSKEHIEKTVMHLFPKSIPNNRTLTGVIENGKG